MPLNGATKIVSNSRFKKLFCLEEFITFLDISKFRDKSLTEVSKSDVEDRKWRIKLYEEEWNCSQILTDDLGDATSGELGGLRGSMGRRFVMRIASEQEADENPT